MRLCEAFQKDSNFANACAFTCTALYGSPHNSFICGDASFSDTSTCPPTPPCLCLSCPAHPGLVQQLAPLSLSPFPTGFWACPGGEMAVWCNGQPPSCHALLPCVTVLG
eukprot:1143154-Pelagomonas_calceolata.AAC.4